VHYADSYGWTAGEMSRYDSWLVQSESANRVRAMANEEAEVLQLKQLDIEPKSDSQT
jgi:hypothetical protein